MSDLYIIQHEHRHGASVYLARSNHYPTEEEVIEKLHIDFEPELLETIDINQAGDIADLDKT